MITFSLTSKKQTPDRTKSTVTSYRKSMLLYLFVFIGSVASLAGLGVATYSPAANAQAAVPVESFTTTYAAFTPSSSSKLPPAERCNSAMNLYGARPTGGGTYPVLLYVPGTYGDYTDVEGKTFVQHAAAQGFVAMAVEYNSTSTNTQAGYAGHAFCIFDQNHANSALTNACAVSGADCSRGALVAGFSQGGAIALISKNYTANVNAVWTIGVSANIYPNNTVAPNAIAAPNGTRALPNNKLVMNMGQTSNAFTKNLTAADLPSLKKMTGADCGTAFNCLGSNGAGYYVVANSEVADGTADHCYWEGNGGCKLSPTTLEIGFAPPATTNWSMIRNLDWLRSQLAL